MRNLIGTSTFMFNDRPFAETLSLIRGKLPGIEICPAYTGTLHAMPLGEKGLDPDLWRTALAGAEVDELKEMLSGFSFRTVHAAMGKHTRVASPDERERERGRERCLDAIRFDAAIGASLVTFHAGPTGNRYYEERPEYRRRLVDFGRRAAALAGEFGLTAGTEVFDYNLIDEIGAENFGVLFDIGHAANVLPAGPDECTDRVLEFLEEAGDRVVEFHVHGVRWDGLRRLDHVPFAFNDCLDYKRIVRFVKDRGIKAPWVFEIQVGLDSSEAILAACEEARDFLIKCWEEE